MNRSILTMAGGLLLLACGGNEADQQQEAEQQAQAIAAQLQAALNEGTMQAQQAAQPTQPQAAQAQAAQAQAGESNFGTVTLTPGFMPDPHQVEGTSGGATDASTLGAGCVGFISGTPDHLFVASGVFSNLRILARSNADVTLVVQKPDGTYLCNDDFETTNPLVEGNFPAGTYKIWIGSYEQGVNSRYTLGFSELPTMPSSLTLGS